MCPFTRFREVSGRWRGPKLQECPSWAADEPLPVQSKRNCAQFPNASSHFRCAFQPVHDVLCHLWKSLLDHGKRICPRRPVRCRCHAPCASQTKPSHTHWEGCQLPCCQLLFLCARESAHERLHRLPHAIVVSLSVLGRFTRWQCAEDVVASWPCTLHKNLPPTLEIGNPSDCWPQFALVFQPPLDHTADKLRRPQGSAQNLDAAWTPHFLPQIFQICRLCPSAIPRSGLSCVELDPCAHQRLLLENVVRLACSVWRDTTCTSSR